MALQDDDTPRVTDFRGRERRRPVRAHEWTAAKRAIFLGELAGGGSVRGASAAAGMAERTAYALRARDPGFAEEWREAIATAVAGLETMVMRKARGETDPELEGLNVELACYVIAQHKAQLAGERRPGRPVRTASRAELTASLKRLLAEVKRRQGKARQGKSGRER